MILDVRTMYIAMAATCFAVAAALLTLPTQQFRRDGALHWALGWAFHGVFWLLLALRGTIGDFLSIVVANTFMTAGYAFLYAAVRQFRGRSFKAGILLFPPAATFIFLWYFSAHMDNLFYRVVFMSLLTVLQIAGIALALLRNVAVKDRRSHWLTGFAFLAMAVVWLNRLVEALTLPNGQLSVLQVTTFRYASGVVGLAVVVLSSIGFALMMRKRAEDTLRRSEQRFRSLFEASRDSILLENQETGRILGANPAACRLYGYSLEEFLTLKNTEISAEPEKTEAAVLQSVREIPFRLHRKKDGTIFPVEISGGYFTEGNLRLHTAFIRDITDRKKTEGALRESEEKYRRLFDDAVLGVFQTTSEGKIITANAAFARMYGYSSPDEIMAAVSDIATSLYADPSHRPSVVRIIEEARQPVCVENMYKRKDGSTFVGSLHAWTARNSKRELILEGFVEDITERKRAEEKLRTSQLQLAEAADLARIAYWEHDEATGEFIFNDAFYELYGTTADREGGYRMTREEYARRFVDPDDIEELGRQIDENRACPRTDHVEQYEHRAARRDGEVIHILTRNRVIMDESGQVLKAAGVNQDITARKKMEEALRESETKLRAILDGSRDAIGVSKDGLLVFANPACVSLFGYETADEIIGMPLIDLVAPESRGFFSEMMKKRAMGEPTPTLYEVTALKKDGTTFLLEISVSAYVLKGKQFSLAILRDITERETAEKLLEEKEERFRKIFEESLLGIVMAGSDHRFVRANPAFCRMLGYPEQELTALTFEDITHPEHVAEDTLHVNELFMGKISVYRTEKRYLRKDKEIVWGSATVTIVRDKSDEFLYFLTMVEDITQRKQAEGERATLEDQLRQAQKMEAIGTLAGGVAHDFNNILTVIVGLGNLIQADIEKDNILRPYIDRIVASSEKAADLTQSLLAFSRKQRITPEPHTVNGVVTSTAKLLKRLLPEDIGLKTDLTGKDTRTMLDVTQIGQVLMNLATNSRDAMPHGGSLIIRTERSKLDENFKKIHGFGRPGNYVKLSVSDTGIGMDESTMKRIFEPFFTTKEVGKGTGLGLASAYGIVKQHDGYITVSSALSMGTTFDIYLPLIDTPHPRRVSAVPETKGGAETILIVEDDRDVRSTLTRILEKQGYITIEAMDGDDALRLYEEHRTEVDLIILDVVMPGRNGKEVLDEITRINPSVKAVFVSGYTGDIVIDKGVENDSVDFLQKPLSVPKLLSKVREVLDR